MPSFGVWSVHQALCFVWLFALWNTSQSIQQCYFYVLCISESKVWFDVWLMHHNWWTSKVSTNDPHPYKRSKTQCLSVGRASVCDKDEPCRSIASRDKRKLTQGCQLKYVSPFAKRVLLNSWSTQEKAEI